MVYTIKYDGRVVASTIGDGNQNIYGGKLKLQANSAGELSFNLPYGHESYGVIGGDGIVSVERDGHEIFFGIAKSEKIDRYRSKSITCEGALAMLSDVEVSDGSTITMSGICELLSNSTWYTWTTHSYITMRVDGQTVKDVVSGYIKENGGYITIKRDGENLVLGYMSSATRKSVQEIHDGDNLIDISIETDYDDETVTVGVSAVDKSVIDGTQVPFDLLDIVRVVALTHEFSDNMMISKIEIDMSNNANTRITLGSHKKTLTEQISTGDKT